MIGDDPLKFDLLVKVITENAPRYAQKATWVMEHCCNKYPHLVDPHISALLAQIQVKGHHGVRRGILRSIALRPMNEDQAGIAIDLGFELFSSAEESVAVKVFTMDMLWCLCKPYPELINELKLHIEAQLPYQTAYFKSKAAKILAALKK